TAGPVARPGRRPATRRRSGRPRTSSAENRSSPSARSPAVRNGPPTWRPCGRTSSRASPTRRPSTGGTWPAPPPPARTAPAATAPGAYSQTGGRPETLDVRGAARADAYRQYDARGGAHLLSEDTKNRVFGNALVEQESQVRRELLSAEKRLLAALYPNISAVE